MPEYPILVFPEPVKAERAKLGGGGRPPRMPNAGAQAQRLAPQFRRLQQALRRQRVALQRTALGLQPESALVLETVGPIQNFLDAVRKVDGLEWLGEMELDDIAPAYGFEDERDAEKPLRGQVFLVMVDQRALSELQRLFLVWKDNPEKKFPRGLAPLRHVFAQLHTIRPWDAQDRIADTGIFEDWQQRATAGQEVVPFEAELWFRQMDDRREQSEAYLRAMLVEAGGEVRQTCVIPEIAYHGVLGRIPIERASEIASQPNVGFLQCEDIMQLRPVGQCASGVGNPPTSAQMGRAGRPPTLPAGDARVALFDGLPLTGHDLLDGRLIVDDPDGYESGYQAHERVHGTAMASVVCHGDLGSGGASMATPLYVRPIMRPRRGFDGLFTEAIPEDVLPVDLIQRAVRRLFEGEAGGPPAAPAVRVINLSVCDPARPLDRGMSSWARLLDWLSWKYNVLFVVSAGNHSREIELDVPRRSLSGLDEQRLEAAVIEALAVDTRHRRLLSPAEAINSVTVAAAHSDDSGVIPTSRLINPFLRDGRPSTISAHGPGYRRAMKPDVLLPGGRQLLSEKLGNAHSKAVLETQPRYTAPGQMVAAPGRRGATDRTVYTCGTSNAAALASHWGDALLSAIDDLRTRGDTRLSPEYDAVLVKALLVHGADWADARPLYESILKTGDNSRVFTDYVGRFLGYGFADVERAVTCTGQRVTVLGIGELGDGDGHEYEFPLPPSLSASAEKRRLTVTLSWLTPVSNSNRNYRIAHLWFSPKNDLAGNRVCGDHRAVQRGTVQHEVLEGEEAVDFQDGDTATIKVNCREDGGTISEPIRYGLAVTLEVAEGVNIPVYAEVRDRVRMRVPVAGRGGGS